MRAKITKKLVDELVATDKVLVVFDSELAGFALKAMPSGKQSYQVRYRMGGRRSPLKTLTLGRHGLLTPDQARRQALAFLGDIQRGIDPAEEKARKVSEDRGALTVKQLSAEFLDRGCDKIKPSSREQYERAFRLHINPAIGALRVKDVVPGDVDRLHNALGRENIKTTANRSVAILSKFFTWAIRAGYRPSRDNPCKGLERFEETKRKRYLSAVEIGALGEAIRTCEVGDVIDPWQACLFRCLLLTGMRRDELRTLPWGAVDFGRKMILLADSKTGARDVPMSAPVEAQLTALPRLAGNPFVFCGTKPGQAVVNVAKPWTRVLQAARIEKVRLHDLRHTAASIGVATGASLHLIGGVLGHKNSATTARYAHLSDDPVRATSEVIAKRISAVLDAKPGTDSPGADVVPLRKTQ